MTVFEVAQMRGLSKAQVVVVEQVAQALVKNNIVATRDHFYQLLASDKAVLSVQDAARILGVCPHYIRTLGKKGLLQIDGRAKMHRIKYSSLLDCVLSKTDIVIKDEPLDTTNLSVILYCNSCNVPIGSGEGKTCAHCKREQLCPSCVDTFVHKCREVPDDD